VPGTRTLRAWRCVSATLIVMVATSHTGLWAQVVQINGAGATAPYPIYSAWFAAYSKLNPAVSINYLSIGSSAGIQQISEQIVFFGATDTPMTEDEFQEAQGRILHLPTVISAVVPIYHLPGVSAELKFTGPVLADIFLGRITNWNDPAIARLNAGVTLPPFEITTVYRSDGSGTSFIFGDFLAKTSPHWRRTIGANRLPNLPVGIGARGSEGVSSEVLRTPGAIGYVELTYAVRNKIAFGSVQNAEGEFVRPSVESATAAAAAAVKSMPRDFRVSITNAPGSGAYPIASFTWILLYQNTRDKPRSKLMVEFMRWALTDGQTLAPELGYAPLPAPIVELELAALATIRVS
jgi:phosphate transport system substrate-binding protein